ncbi:MAG: histidine triad nucleotide-binding protein [Oscillospiraceae bacterium]|nr:histidine triad nucleotide-binding protein [Oscillospiraceae bacterium]
MENCIFCKIINGELPSATVYEDENTLAFRDINPAAPIHVLVIPKQHIISLDDINTENKKTAANCLAAIPEIAKNLGLVGGYRVITNIGKDGGQVVPHLHFHLLGGKKFKEKIV